MRRPIAMPMMSWAVESIPVVCEPLTWVFGDLGFILDMPWPNAILVMSQADTRVVCRPSVWLPVVPKGSLGCDNRGLKRVSQHRHPRWPRYASKFCKEERGRQPARLLSRGSALILWSC